MSQEITMRKSATTQGRAGIRPPVVSGDDTRVDGRRDPEEGNDVGRAPEEMWKLTFPSQGTLEQALLRACDVVVASGVLILLSPVLLLIALAIKLDSPGPVIYRQLRVGIDRRRGRTDESGGRRTRDVGGRPFMMYKFRTMHVNAEAETGPVWAGSEDDRVTRVGRLLRRHRLDELPQFWNVLRGDMAVVGPRPERPSLLSHLRDRIEAYGLRQRVLPGITGWAQVHRDSDQCIDDVRSKLEYDLEYVSKRSMAFDLRIMARTLPVMLERESVQASAVQGGERARSTERASSM